MNRGTQYIVAVLIAALSALVIVSSPIEPEAFHLPPLPKLEGPMEQNFRLAKVEKLFEGELFGPESMSMDSINRIYVGLSNGTILRSIQSLPKDSFSFEEVVHLGSRRDECGSVDFELECGRPLGHRFVPSSALNLFREILKTPQASDVLLVASAHQGLQAVTLEDGQPPQLHPLVSSFNGSSFTFVNDVVITSNGTVFFTQSSRKWHRSVHMYDILERQPLGSLFRFDPKRNVTEEVVSELYFANGIELSPKEDFLLFVETSSVRVKRLWLTGSRMGTVEEFAGNLPCIPDNIRWDSQLEVFWLGCATKRVAPFSLVDTLGPFPLIRRILARVIPLSMLHSIAPRYGMILALNMEGSITESLQDPDGMISFISEVHRVGNVLYLGSFRNPFLGRLVL